MSSRPDHAADRFPVLIPTLQISFYHRLIQSQEEYLLPALLEQASQLEIAQLDQELISYAGEEKLRYLWHATA